MTDTASDRRQYPRTQVSFDIDVWVDDAQSQGRTGGRLVVLSAGGAFLELDDGYPVGRHLRLRFELATLGKIGCQAIVRRISTVAGPALSSWTSTRPIGPGSRPSSRSTRHGSVSPLPAHPPVSCVQRTPWF